MGKRSTKRSREIKRLGRVALVNAKPRLPRPPVLPSLSLLEDRRFFHPERAFQPALSFVRSASRIVLGGENVNKRKKSSRSNRHYGNRQTKAILVFNEPSKVAVCIRRHHRREVLFALNKAGKSGQRPPRRNWWSSISCR